MGGTLPDADDADADAAAYDARHSPYGWCGGRWAAHEGLVCSLAGSDFTRLDERRERPSWGVGVAALSGFAHGAMRRRFER
ncbi:hypothetical protein BP6252_08582 [Coleophoma cylindrospora]|uniref:Uncharacterized protein n=1 Tax=Coleophoma cylindrospora TaxID=1849047 RepID=A0A3D8R685_9HELO|nr:hypothetical protein BP6252_08582 [Coleophoma cylindrospora]